MTKHEGMLLYSAAKTLGTRLCITPALDYPPGTLTTFYYRRRYRRRYLGPVRDHRPRTHRVRQTQHQFTKANLVQFT